MNKKKRCFLCAGIFCILSILIYIGVSKYVSMKYNKDNIFVIGVSQANLYEPWRISMHNELKEAAKNYKNIKVIYKDAGGDTDKQKKDIEDLINFGADILIVSINDSNKLKETVKKVNNIKPVIVLDRAVDGYDYTLYIGPDNEDIGRQAGNLIMELTNGQEANVIEIQGFLNSNPDEERSKGFKKVVNQNKNINIERTIVAEWKKDEAYDKVKSIIDENRNINVIFAHSDYMALGAYKAVNEAGLENVKIIGVDGLSGIDGGINMVEKGMIDGTFICPTGGKEAIEYAVKILNKVKVPKNVILKCERVTKEDVSKYKLK